MALIPLFVTANAFFALLHPVFGLIPNLPAILAAAAVSASLFWMPSVGWIRLVAASRAPGTRILARLAISTAGLLTCLLALRFLSIGVSPSAFWNLLWAFMNLGMVAAAFSGAARSRRGRVRVMSRRETILAAGAFALSFAFYTWGATRVVPPEPDQDLEVLGTGYGLLSGFEPVLLTDRGSTYFFAHPPLLHVYVAASFLLQGGLDDLRFYYDASLAARAAEQGDPVLRKRVAEVELGRIYARYLSRPQYVAARTPNIFFASVTVALLFVWAGRICHRYWLAAAIAVVYASSPEVFVRSSYGGYFALGSLLTVLMLLAVSRLRREPGRSWVGAAYLTGFMSALADHKLIVLPVAIAAWELVSQLRVRSPFRWRPVVFHPVILGFALGTALFWAWGLSVSVSAFIQDHFRDHLLDRLTHDNRLGYAGYPTPLALWLEFLRHTGILLVPIGCWLLVSDLRRRTAAFLAFPRGIVLVWIGLLAVAFTMVDWRMTKHLIPMVLPISLAFAQGRQLSRQRLVLTVVVLFVAFVSNVWSVRTLATSFESFIVTPAW